MPATILDVVDNFLDGEQSVHRMTGKRLMEFGEEIQRFSRDCETPALEPAEHPSYLGGWPSANFWNALNSEFVLSTMLYSGQVLVRDPLADWFANERYAFPVIDRSRGGYLRVDGEPAVAATRQFLSAVIPALQEVRPLVEAGALAMVPYRSFRYEHRDDVQTLANGLFSVLAEDPVKFARMFDPRELAVEDNARGFFAFAGGDREDQIRSKIRDATDYFAGEYAFAVAHGAHYTAPFRFEAFSCETGLQRALFRSPSERIVNALLKSKLPVFAGLTPDVVATIRNDDNFGGFRAELFQAYRDIPTGASQEEVDIYIAEAEAALLMPKIERALRDVDRGRLATVIRGVAGFGFGVAASVLLGTATGGATVAGQVAAAAGNEGMSSAWSRLRSRAQVPDPTGTIWKRLANHGRSVENELADVRVSEVAASDYWGIPPAPSMAVTVTSGMLILDHVPQFSIPDKPGGPEQPYLECGCGSGEKWRFCCRGIKPLSGLALSALPSTRQMTS